MRENRLKLLAHLIKGDVVRLVLRIKMDETGERENPKRKSLDAFENDMRTAEVYVNDMGVGEGG